MSLVLSACSGLLGGSSPSHSATPTTTSTTSTTVPNSPKLSVAKRTTVQAGLKKLEGVSAPGFRGTFKLTYVTQGKGAPPAATIEEMPPDELFKWANAEIIFNGKTAYYCTMLPNVRCTKGASISDTPEATLANAYSAASYASLIKQWEQTIHTGLNPAHAEFFTKDVAGLPSRCIYWDYQESSVKYCVTSNGIVSYLEMQPSPDAKPSSFELSKYSTKVSASDFTVPAGAKIIG